MVEQPQNEEIKNLKEGLDAAYLKGMADGKDKAKTIRENLYNACCKKDLEIAELQVELDRKQAEIGKLEYEREVFRTAYEGCNNEGQAAEIRKQDEEIEKLKTQLMDDSRWSAEEKELRDRVTELEKYYKNFET